MAETLKEAIAEEEAMAKPERRIFMIQFSQKIYFNLGSGSKHMDRYDPLKPEWKGWEVCVVAVDNKHLARLVSFRHGRREIVLPFSQCAVEWRDACPRCQTFIALKSNSGHCPSSDCTWPKAEIHHCPECRAQLKEDAAHCPNKACRWGWKDPDAPADEGDESLMPKDTRATITGKCEQCDSAMRDGHCPLGCDKMREPQPERSQWPTNKEA